MCRRSGQIRNLCAHVGGANKARVLELIERVTNGHDLDALEAFTSNPAVPASAGGLLRAFPDLAPR